VAREKKNCFVKLRPRRFFHKKIGVLTCLKSRPKYSQSEHVLKKKIPFCLPCSKKTCKVKSLFLIFNQKSIDIKNVPERIRTHLFQE
jgi:hypothetical protein